MQVGATISKGTPQHRRWRDNFLIEKGREVPKGWKILIESIKCEWQKLPSPFDKWLIL